MIIIPALIYSIQELKNALSNPSEWADKKDWKWVQTIQRKIEFDSREEKVFFKLKKYNLKEAGLYEYAY